MILSWLQSFEDHVFCLREVLQILCKAKLTMNPDKCHFCVSSVRYLGFIIDAQGIHADPEKIASIIDYPVPCDVKKAHSFLGLISWYRQFVEDLATIAEPITRLLKVDQRWEWAGEQQAAFARIKQVLTSPPLLVFPDFSFPFLIPSWSISSLDSRTTNL